MVFYFHYVLLNYSFTYQVFIVLNVGATYCNLKFLFVYVIKMNENEIKTKIKQKFLTPMKLKALSLTKFKNVKLPSICCSSILNMPQYKL